MGEKPFFLELLDRRENQPPPPEEEEAVAERVGPGSSWVEARSLFLRSICTGEARPEWDEDAGPEVLMAAGGAERRWVWAMRA